MKNLLPFLFILLLMVSCRPQSSDEARDIQLLTDSTVYTNNNVYSDTIAGMQADNNIEAEEAPVVTAQPKEKVIVKYVPVKTVIVEKQTSPSNTTASIPPVATPPVVDNSANTGSETVSTGNHIPDAGTPGEVKKEEKKGWSKAAQGAVIGGVAGAVGGAIISKKKGVGAVVGAVVGAAGGYILGKKKDKKDAANN